jgi:hypothetical protein
MTWKEVTEGGGGMERETTVVLNVALWNFGFPRMRNFCSVLSLILKKWKYAYMITILCVSVPGFPPWTNLYGTWYVYHDTWGHLNGVLHKFLRRTKSRNSIPCRSRDFSLQHWVPAGPHQFLYNEYWEHFAQRINGRGVYSGTHLHAVLESRMYGATPPLPNTPSRRGA